MFAGNIKYLRQKAGVSQQKLAEELGINRSTLADYEKGTYEPGIDKLKRFAEYFNHSLDDLLAIDLSRNKAGRPSGINNDNIRILALTTDEEGNERIQYVPRQARAGYLEGYGDPEYISKLEHFNLPGLPTGTYRAFQIKGDSMPPINDGFVVIGQYVENWQDLKVGKRYVFLTRDEGIVFKRIASRLNEKNGLVLMSDNPQYEPYKVKLEDIVEAWGFYAYIGFPGEYKGPVDDIIERLGRIENKIDNN